MASATLEEKINKIRQQNEEIRRRHEEVEADKQNAAKLNALVKMVPPTDWPERKEPPEFSNPPPPRSNGNSKPKNSAREYRGQQQQYHAGGGDGKKTHVFAEGDGPPPDPTYNFLADSEREERSREDSRDERFRGRGGPLRGSRKRGGGRDGYSKDYWGAGPVPRDATKPEYEAWRAERNRIDEARISRQRTAEGNWRREWDNNKINVEEDEAGTPKVTRLDLGDIPRKEHKDFDKWQADGNDHDSSRGRGGKQYISRGTLRGSHNNRVYQHSNSFEQFHGPVSPPAIKTPVSPNGVDDRMVLATDKSLKVIVNHGTTVPKGPVMSVKVSPASIAGTGRVGPRQKPRILYSSQSEGEVGGQEFETLSRHKSPEDKANRVSFNRDVSEQQRYAPKSPHPQRKGDSNSKSPYLGRKEYKHDCQQQRHGENEPKSPYLQRREFKDPPKSPHFQKKLDFTNRDSHVKQKNSSSVNESFRTNNPQRRTLEKTKPDSQKFTVPRKFEDTSAPKPQRINKRTDKSKGFQARSKEAQESSTNENTTQANNLGVEVPTKNIVNGNESHNDVKKYIIEDSVAVGAAQDHQNRDNDLSKRNIDSETLSPGLEEDLESISDNTKSIINSEPVIPTSADADEGPGSEIVSNNETMHEIKLHLKNIETNNIAESATLHSGGNKTDECNENVEDVESDKKVAVIAGTVKKETEISTIIENEKDTINGTDEIKNIQVTCDNESKQNDNSAKAADLDNSEKLEEQILAVENEFKIDETKDEVSPKSEETVDEVLQAQDIVDLKKSEENKVESVKQELKIEETKNVASLKPEEIPNEIPQTEDLVKLEKLEETRLETVGKEFEIKEMKDEVFLKPKETVNEIPKAQDVVDLVKLEDKVTTAENGLQIDETKDEISPKLEEIAEPTIAVEKVDSSNEKETPQIIEEQVPNNEVVVNQVVKE